MLLEIQGLPADVLGNRLNYINTVRKGLPGEVVRSIMAALPLEREAMARILGVDASNLSRLYRKPELSRNQTEVLLGVLKVWNKALSVFEAPDIVEEWMHTPVHALANSRPLDLMDTFEGRDWLLSVLRKIESAEFT